MLKKLRLKNKFKKSLTRKTKLIKIGLVMLGIGVILFSVYKDPILKSFGNEQKNQKSAEQQMPVTEKSQEVVELSNESVLDAINAERNKLGLEKLSLNGDLTQYANELNKGFIASGKIDNDIYKNLAEKSKWYIDFSDLQPYVLYPQNDSQEFIQEIKSDKNLNDLLFGNKYKCIGVYLSSPMKNLTYISGKDNPTYYVDKLLVFMLGNIDKNKNSTSNTPVKQNTSTPAPSNEAITCNQKALEELTAWRDAAVKEENTRFGGLRTIYSIQKISGEPLLRIGREHIKLLDQINASFEKEKKLIHCP